MTEKEQWNTFYETVGGKYICEECGNILTWFQYDSAGGLAGKGWLIGFLISFVLTPLIGAIYLLSFAPKRGCPICHAKKERIFPLNSPEGINLFKKKHPEHAHLLDHLPTIEE